MSKGPDILRVASWNIHGAAVPGKSSHRQQERAWHHLAGLGADVVLLQEVEWSAIPSWATQEWAHIKGDEVPDLLDAPWGSLVGARPKLPVFSRLDLFSDPLLRVLYGYVVAAALDVPHLGRLLLASVHAPARTVADFLKNVLKRADAIDVGALQHIRLAGLPPWCCDLTFDCLVRHFKGQRFVVGGDWNNSRLFDQTMPQYAPASAEFFERCAAHEWFECHKEKGEQRSYLKDGSRPYQLDHVFCDPATGKQMTGCSVQVDPVVRELSDHAPVITDFRLG